MVQTLASTGWIPLAQVSGLLEGESQSAGILDGLRKLGLPIAVDGDGLRWTATADDLCADVIRRELMASGMTCDLATQTLVDSTNSRLQAAAAAGDPGPRVLLAECQLAGRGRRQRQWQARFGEAIPMSLLIDAGRPVHELPGLAIAVGATLARTLHAWGVDDVTVKWPNDVLLAGAKVAGVLVEAVGALSAARLVVIGVGVNWALSPASHRAIDQAAASLCPSLPIAMRDRNRVAAGLIAALLAMIDRFRAHGLGGFLEDFARFDALQGRSVNVHAGGTVTVGYAMGLAPDGSLRIEHADGERHYHSADVSVRAT